MSMSWVAYRETACLTRERPAIVIRKLRSAALRTGRPSGSTRRHSAGQSRANGSDRPGREIQSLPPDAARSPPKISAPALEQPHEKAGIRKASYTPGFASPFAKRRPSWKRST